MTSPILPDSSTSSRADYSSASDVRTTSESARDADVREAIKAATRAFLAAFARADAAAMAAGYTTDGQVLPPNGEPAQGRKAIETFWRDTISLGFAGATLELAELYHTPGERTATEVGRYNILTADGQTADRGKYVVIWQRDDDGTWLIHRDIWASSLPLPGSA